MKDFLLATEALISAATPKSARHRRDRPVTRELAYIITLDVKWD